MQVFGNQQTKSLYTGRSTNAGMFDTNSTNDQVASTIKQKGETFTIRDVDDNANLQVSVRPGSYYDAPQLLVTNSDERKSPNGAEHVVVAQFDLPHMGDHAALQLAQQDLTGKVGVDTVSVTQHQNGGYEVEIGEYAPGMIHHGFTIRDSEHLARPRGL
jgi:hypothetical protein